MTTELEPGTAPASVLFARRCCCDVECMSGALAHVVRGILDWHEVEVMRSPLTRHASTEYEREFLDGYSTFAEFLGQRPLVSEAGFRRAASSVHARERTRARERRARRAGR